MEMSLRYKRKWGNVIVSAANYDKGLFFLFRFLYGNLFYKYFSVSMSIGLKKA